MRPTAESLDLPDDRLNARYATIVDRLSEAPDRSFPEIFTDWAETKAAYRFFDNERVTHEALIAGQRRATQERIEEADQTTMLYVQDTTGFSFQHHPATTGLGSMGSEESQGFWVHSTLAVTPQGVPYGVVGQQVWVRDEPPSSEEASVPFQERESVKWVADVTHPTPWQVIYVADREADSYPVMDHILAHQHDFLIRAHHDRHLATSETSIHDRIAQEPVQDHLSIEIPASPTRAARTARLAVRWTTVQIPAPAHSEVSSAALEVTYLDIQEVSPPGTVDEPIHWLLVTSCPLHTEADARTLVRYYTYRWLIERFHYVLKSGCRLEDRQLRTRARLQRLLGVFSDVAWHLLWLTYQSRQTPEAPCTRILARRQWQILYRIQHPDDALPNSPPTLHQAVGWIAQLGGFLARTNDGEPGVKVLWRGWRRLQDMVKASKLSL